MGNMCGSPRRKADAEGVPATQPQGDAQTPDPTQNDSQQPQADSGTADLAVSDDSPPESAAPVPARAKRKRAGRPPALDDSDAALVVLRVRSKRMDASWQASSLRARAQIVVRLLRDERDIDVGYRAVLDIFKHELQDNDAATSEAARHWRKRQSRAGTDSASPGAVADAAVTLTPAGRALPRARAFKAENSLSRKAATTPHAVALVERHLPHLVCVDSVNIRVCLATGVVSAAARRRGTGPWLKVHAYAAIAPGADGCGARSRLVWVPASEVGQRGFTGANYAATVRRLTLYIRRRSSVQCIAKPPAALVTAQELLNPTSTWKVCI